MRRACACALALVLISACSGGSVETNDSSTLVPGASTTSSEIPPPSATPDATNPTTSNATTAPVTTTTVPDITADLAAFDAVIESRVIGAGSNDVSVALVRDGEVLHTFTAAKGRPGMDPATPFRLASISKTVTAIVALQLVEDGTLELDNPVVGGIARRAGYALGDPRMESITLRQLLSHSTGFGDHLDYFFAPTTDEVSTMLTKALGGRLYADPGTSYWYSNINFHLVGMLIEQATGQSYESAVRAMLLEPLGLTSFRLAVDDANVDGAPWYAVTSNRRYMAMLAAAGAWTASASDVALLLDSVNIATVRSHPERWHPLSEESMAAMFTPQTPKPAAPTWDYGLGVRIFDSGAAGHSGSIESVHTMAITRPDGLTLVVLVNGGYPKETDDLLGILFEAELAARGLSAEVPA